MTSFASHPQRNSIRLQLRQNQLLQGLSAGQWAELEPLLVVGEYRKGDPLVRQGDEEMEQFFILEGMLKRVVSNPHGREMILRFAAETEMDTSYAAWRLRTPVPYSIVAVTKVRTNAFGVFVHTEPALVPDPTPLTSGEGCEETALVAGPRFGEGAQLALGYELSAVGQAELPSSGWSPFAVAVTVVLAGAGLWAALEPLRRRVDARTAPVSPGSSRSSDSA